MFKNPKMQAYLMSVIASDPAAETIKESVKNQGKLRHFHHHYHQMCGGKSMARILPASVVVSGIIGYLPSSTAVAAEG